MELKLQGFYVARQLSFKDVTYKVMTVDLSEGDQELYDFSAKVVSLASCGLIVTLHIYI